MGVREKLALTIPSFRTLLYTMRAITINALVFSVALTLQIVFCERLASKEVCQTKLDKKYPSLWPYPENFKHAEGLVFLSPKMRVVHNFKDNAFFSNAYGAFGGYVQQNCNEYNEKHLLKLYDELPKQNTAARSLYEKLGFANPQRSLDMVYLHELRVEIERPELTHLSETTDEAYTLELKGGQLTIQSKTQYGARHGLVTLWNLLESRNVLCDDGRRLCNFSFLPYSQISITDAPRFHHRGLMLDTSRNYQRVETIRRIIKGMGLVKLNVLHWHIVDSPSFPLVGKRSAEYIQGPSCLNHELCQASYDFKEVYTSDTVREIKSYAKLNGIRLVIEIDTPSHTASWGSVHPELITNPNVECCTQPPCGLLDLRKESLVKDIVTKVWDDVLELVDNTELVHLGGDEVRKECFGEDTGSLVTNYMQWLIDEMRTKHKGKSVIWSDMVTSYDSDYDRTSTLVQVWLPKDLQEVLDKGYDVIVSNYSAYYLDCGIGNWLYLDHKNWCDPFRSWYYFYMYDMYRNIKASQHKQIIGGEVALWSEQAGTTNSETLIWPRAAAAAETWWTQNPEIQKKNPSSILDVQERLRRTMLGFKIQGVPSSPMQQENCGVNDECDKYYTANGPSVFPPKVPDYDFAMY